CTQHTPRPSILAVAHEDATRALLTEELETRYGHHYAVSVVATNGEALTHLAATAEGGVALVLADRQEGLATLVTTRELHPHAKRGVLVGWNEQRSAREEIVGILMRGEADYYVTRPTATPDERFHRAITEFLDDWWRLSDRAIEAVQVIGEEDSARI